MRVFVLVLAATILVSPGGAVAQVAGSLNTDRLRDGDQIQPKMPDRLRNPCAEYGAGFAPIAGTSTCARIGGSISVGVGTVNGAPKSTR